MSEAQTTQATVTNAVRPTPLARDNPPASAKTAKPKAPAKTAKKTGKDKPKANAKGKAKPKAAKKDAGERLVPADLSQYHIDKEKKTAAGNPSVDCADDVAEMLRGKALDAVYALVAKKIGEEEKTLRAKYKHLNVGMQRMNLGNRLRGVLNAK